VEGEKFKFRKLPSKDFTFIIIIIIIIIIKTILTFPACFAPEKFLMLNNLVKLRESYPSYQCHGDDVTSHVTIAIKDVLPHCKNRLLSIQKH